MNDFLKEQIAMYFKIGQVFGLVLLRVPLKATRFNIHDSAIAFLFLAMSMYDCSFKAEMFKRKNTMAKTAYLKQHFWTSYSE